MNSVWGVRKSKVSDIKFIFKSNKNGYFLEFLSSSWCSSETAQVASGHDGDYTGKCSRLISQKTDCCYLLTSRGSVQKRWRKSQGQMVDTYQVSSQSLNVMEIQPQVQFCVFLVKFHSKTVRFIKILWIIWSWVPLDQWFLNWGDWGGMGANCWDLLFISFHLTK